MPNALGLLRTSYAAVFDVGGVLKMLSREDRGKESLYAHQRAIANFIKTTPKSAIWASVGSGKSRAVLTALVELFDDFEIDHVLIVGPGRVIRDVWPDEIAQWRMPLTFMHLTGSPGQREALLRSRNIPQITFITPDLLPWLRMRYVKTLPPWSTLVLDEASLFAESSTRRWKALNPFCQVARRVVQLTGTPASNGLVKLWAQMFLLDRGEALGRTKSRFLATFFEQNPYTQKYELRKGMEKSIHRLVAPLVLRVDAADHMDMPPTITSAIKVHLPEKLKTQYKRFETDFLLKLENGGVFAAANAASLSGRLRQFCSGALYDEQHDWHPVHDLKLDALEDLLTALDGEPLLLFYQFVSDAERIQARFKQAVRLDDKGAMGRWLKNEVPLLIAHPASGGHGLNLQHGGAKHTCYYGLPWSLELYDQSFGRLNGARAKTTSYVHHIICAGTIEEQMSVVLGEKARTQADLLNAVKRPLTVAA